MKLIEILCHIRLIKNVDKIIHKKQQKCKYATMKFIHSIRLAYIRTSWVIAHLFNYR